jgi:hypothetical protein
MNTMLLKSLNIKMENELRFKKLKNFNVSYLVDKEI